MTYNNKIRNDEIIMKRMYAQVYVSLCFSMLFTHYPCHIHTYLCTCSSVFIVSAYTCIVTLLCITPI